MFICRESLGPKILVRSNLFFNHAGPKCHVYQGHLSTLSASALFKKPSRPGKRLRVRLLRLIQARNGANASLVMETRYRHAPKILYCAVYSTLSTSADKEIECTERQAIKAMETKSRTAARTLPRLSHHATNVTRAWFQNHRITSLPRQVSGSSSYRALRGSDRRSGVQIAIRNIMVYGCNAKPGMRIPYR